MAIDTLKSRLIRRIEEIDDEAVIKKLFTTLENQELISEDYMELSNEEDLAIDRAMKDIQEGNLLREKDAEKKIKQWI
ncbi:MAG: hypothetical protein EA390_00480 [Balneolaceae bacterium]|nr:MAG: hypothetical protein EA390_00480 [Balneolaceae bacterium]